MVKKKSFNIGSSLSQALMDTADAAKNFKGELHIEIIPIRKIELDPDNPRDLALNFNDLLDCLVESDPHYERKINEKHSLASLANSINSQGVLNPILVYRFGEKYRVIAGERRTLGSILAGKDSIPARILMNKPSPLKTSLLQWIENIEREDLSLWERINNVEKILGAYATEKSIAIEDTSTNDLINLLNCSKPQAINYKHIIFSSEKLRFAIKQNLVKNIEKAAFISKNSESITDILIEKCSKGATLDELKVIAETNKPVKNEVIAVKTTGPISKKVNFGNTTNINVAKIIFQSILSNKHNKVTSEKYQNIDWNDMKSATKAFKSLIADLEKNFN